MAAKRRQFLWLAVGFSLAVHIAAGLLVVLLPRVLPRDAQPREQGTVELLMVEQKGTEANRAAPPKDSPPQDSPPGSAAAEHQDAPKTEQSKADATTVEARKDETAVPAAKPDIAPPPAAVPGDEPVPPPAAQSEPKEAEADPPPAEKEAMAQPVAPKSQEAPVFDLDGTDSESNAVVLGGRVVPASRDDRFRNRPPVYPVEAEVRGEHGSVVVVIHVSENGVATGADVEESSGFDVLDQAALTAVRKWHFRPAMEAGRSVPFDMPFRFIFEPY